MKSDKASKRAIILVFIGFFIMAVSLLFMKNKDIPQEYEITTIYLASDHIITVEIADTEYLRNRGLMYRDQLDIDKGMLFIFEGDVQHSFWMKNTLIPLDMIFLDDKWMVVDIIEDVPPCEEKECTGYTPFEKYRYVIEVNGGLCKEIGLQIGDQVVRDDLTYPR